MPIHCVIEQTNGPLTFELDNTATFNVELDTYAILPSTTHFSELVRTALIKLGYNANEAMNAKGGAYVLKCSFGKIIFLQKEVKDAICIIIFTLPVIV